jgi:acetylornithine deacetylase/succinyl-diaminopimelate desuccinylase family protein
MKRSGDEWGKVEDVTGIFAEIDNRQEELYEILMTLIRFKTPNPPGGNEKEAQEWVAGQLHKLGCEVDVFDVFPGRPNVVGRLRGSGGGKSVILNGHIDVCEDRLNQKWRRDPYEPYVEGGALFGRGSTDMKGALAAYLFVLTCMQHLGHKYKGDIIFESVIGEERGEPGTKRCLEKGYRADFAIVGESAKSAKVLYAAVGLMNGRITIESPYTLHLQERRHFLHAGGGREGANCIEKMALTIIPALNDLEKHWGVFKKHPLMPAGQALINVFNFTGGGNTFLIPDRCTIDISVYYLPNEDKNTVQKEVEDKINRVSQADEWLSRYPPAIEWEPEPDSFQFLPSEPDFDDAGVKTLMESYRQATGDELSVGGRGAIVDSGWFSSSGIPVLTFGPGDAYWAHRIDERVELSALSAYCKTIALFLYKWCGLAGS